MASGLAYLFSNNNTLETEDSKPEATHHKVTKVEVPAEKPKEAQAPKKVRKAETLEKPSAVTSTPFAGLKAFGSSGGSGVISQADQQASASGSFSDSKSSQTAEVQILSKTDPQFPDAAKKKNITGYVRVQITVDQSSSIKSIDVLDANPEGYFEAAAIDSVKNWKFSAAYQNGTPVESTIKRRIEFKLE